VNVRQPLEPARQIPVRAAEERHRRRHDDRSDHGRVEQQGNCDPKAHLLKHDQVAHGEAPEDRDDDQRGARDQARGRGNPERNRKAVVIRLRELFPDPREQEHLVVHREAKEN